MKWGVCVKARAAWLALAALLALACAARPDPTPTPERWTPAHCAEADALEAALRAQPDAAAAELRIQLAFGGASDLDLWVTDPSQESVYYFNREARSGGALDVDHGCDGDGPRIETIHFTQPVPGRHRVGVDHPRDCGSGASERVFVVAIDDGLTQRWVRGIVPLGVFRAIQHEFAWPLTPTRVGGSACAELPAQKP